MCTDQIRAALFKYLAKGSFPLLAGGELPQWRCLLHLLETDPKKTIEDIFKSAAAEDGYSNVIQITRKVEFEATLDHFANFLGAAHERLCRDHGMSIRPEIQELIQRIRKIAVSHNLLKSSTVNLTADPNTQMGHGMVANELTYVPDGALGVTFGSVPDQQLIGNVAPAWVALKRRVYEDKAGKYGAKPHYVLAHLLNHNLNGPGDNKLNVVPFWATANTQMASRAEGVVKELVLRGVPVHYTIALGPAVGLSVKRQALLAGLGNPKQGTIQAAQKEILEWERHLPEHFLINCTAVDASGTSVAVVNNVRIDNYVPETLPVLT